MQRSYVTMAASMLVLLLATHLMAGDGATSAEPPAFTPEREAAALKFVQEHHPDLSAVVARLESVNRQQYEQAIRELYQQAEKLQHVRVTDEELYALLLTNWKLSSRIEILAARLACATEENKELEAELKQLVRDKVAHERRLVEHRKKRLLENLEKTEESLKWFDENAEQIAQRRFKILLNNRKKQEAPKSKN